MAFTVSVLAALAVFLPTRFGAIPDSGVLAYGIEALAVIGVGVVLGLMIFGFFGLRPALVVGAIAALGSAPFVFGFLRDYDTLTASLVAYAVSTIVCAAMSFRSSMEFDFAKIAARTADYDTAESAEALEAQSDDDGRDQNVRTDDDDDDLVRV